MFGKLFGRGKPSSDQPLTETDETRWRSGLEKTNRGLGAGLRNLLVGRKGLDEDTRDELEMLLLSADVGIETSARVLDELDARLKADSGDALNTLGEILADLLEPLASPLQVESNKPFVIMVVGVNGVGKTTSIGKITHALKQQGKQVVLAAGDTFRAAAIEQLQVWGDRNQVPVVAQRPGSDSASVIFDGLQSAQRRGADVLIADTAGRLHNKAHLMDELTKVVRVARKLDPGAPHETLLVVDASTGQNALMQAREFSKATPLTGLVVTKLDGTARGGVLLALADQLKLPVRYIGLGEGIEDLRPFDAGAFIQALLEDLPQSP